MIVLIFFFYYEVKDIIGKHVKQFKKKFFGSIMRLKMYVNILDIIHAQILTDISNQEYAFIHNYYLCNRK